METVKVGSREFRDNFASYLESEAPVTITKHGDTVGYFIPARRRRTDQDRAALREAHAALQKSMVEAGVTEDELLEDFKQMRKARRQ